MEKIQSSDAVQAELGKIAARLKARVVTEMLGKQAEGLVPGVAAGHPVLTREWLEDALKCEVKPDEVGLVAELCISTTIRSGEEMVLLMVAEERAAQLLEQVGGSRQRLTDPPEFKRQDVPGFEGLALISLKAERLRVGQGDGGYCGGNCKLPDPPPGATS